MLWFVKSVVKFDYPCENVCTAVISNIEIQMIPQIVFRALFIRILIKFLFVLDMNVRTLLQTAWLPFKMCKNAKNCIQFLQSSVNFIIIDIYLITYLKIFTIFGKHFFKLVSGTIKSTCVGRGLGPPYYFASIVHDATRRLQVCRQVHATKKRFSGKGLDGKM